MRKMILESEAKNAFCPVTKEVCQGAKCMMWQWSDCDPEVEKRKADPRATINTAKLPKPIIPIKGYCTW